MKNKTIGRLLAISLVLLSALCLLTAATPAFASEYSGTYKSIKYTISEGEVTVNGYTNTGISYFTIPEQIDGYPVTAIADGAFRNFSALTGINIKAPLKRIGNQAFMSCSKLTSITIPEGVTCIGDQAFMSCSKLTSITIPEGVTYIGDQALASCSALTAVSLPSSLEFVGDDLFYCSNRVTYTSYGHGLKYVGNKQNPYLVLAATMNYSGTVTLHPDTAIILDDAFAERNYITDLHIPPSVRFIGTGAFSKYSLSVSKGVHITDLESWCRITFATETSNPLYLGRALYLNGELIEELSIPEGIDKLGPYAFFFNAYVKSIDLPSTLTYVDPLAFKSCTGVERITVDEANPIYECYNNSIIEKNTRTLVLGCRSTTLEQDADIRAIGNNAFYECYITSITLPESVTSIGEYAFYSSDLQYIYIPDGVTIIGKHAFYNCTLLGPVTLPSKLSEIADYAFYGCRNLGGIVIPHGVTRIGICAFTNAYLYDFGVTIPYTVTSIGVTAFYQCQIPTVYYTGTLSQWNAVSISGNNDPIKSATWEHLHTGEWTLVSELSCTTPEIKERTCLGCRELLREEIPALGHDEYTAEAQAPTCTESGWDAYTACSRCAMSTYEELPALGHSGDEWVKIREATFTSAGLRGRICETCGAKEIQETPYKGDLDRDGGISNVDITLLLRELCGWNTAEPLEFADITGDGKINNRDIIALIQKLAERE